MSASYDAGPHPTCTARGVQHGLAAFSRRMGDRRSPSARVGPYPARLRLLTLPGQPLCRATRVKSSKQRAVFRLPCRPCSSHAPAIDLARQAAQELLCLAPWTVLNSAVNGSPHFWRRPPLSRSDRPRAGGAAAVPQRRRSGEGAGGAVVRVAHGPGGALDARAARVRGAAERPEQGRCSTRESARST